jgi:hypothetical protein
LQMKQLLWLLFLILAKQLEHIEWLSLQISNGKWSLSS